MKEPSRQKLSITGRMSQAGADRVGYLWAISTVILAVGTAVAAVLWAIGGLWG